MQYLLKNTIFLVLLAFFPLWLSGQRIYIENNYFFSNGDTIWLNGANTPWDNWNDLGGAFNYNWWNNHFKELHEAGINCTRVWLTCNGGGGVKIDNEGFVTGPTSEFWTDMDSLMSIARRYKIHLMGALISFDHTRTGNPFYAQWRKMYSSEETMDSFVENYAVPLLKRYNDNPYMFSIDVCNEILWVSNTENTEMGSVPWSALQYLVAKTAQRVHEESDVLVCTSNYLKYTSSKYEGNKWSDEALQNLVNDPDAYLDFYKIHYYSWVYPWFDGFHADHTPSFYNIDEKPCISGEFSAKGIYYQDRSTGQDRFLYSTKEAYKLHYQNGWQGAMAWTSNGVDSNGDLNNDLRTATLSFQSKHPDLVGFVPVLSGTSNQDIEIQTLPTDLQITSFFQQNFTSILLRTKSIPKKVIYRVCNSTGNLLEENQIVLSSFENYIEFQNLKPGVYFITVYASGQIFNNSFISK